MTTKESAVLLGILRAAYPRFYAKISPDEVKETAALWATMLSDIGLETAQIALQRLIAICKFPPTIAEIRESIAVVQHEPIPDAGDAWGEVMGAIRKYGIYNPQEAMASLSEPVRRAVERMGFRELCLSENTMADRAHFLRIYETMEKRIKEERRLPAALRESIAAIGQSMGHLGCSSLHIYTQWGNYVRWALQIHVTYNLFKGLMNPTSGRVQAYEQQAKKRARRARVCCPLSG